CISGLPQVVTQADLQQVLGLALAQLAALGVEVVHFRRVQELVARVDRDVVGNLVARARHQRVGKVVLAIGQVGRADEGRIKRKLDRKSTRLNSSHVKISYAVFGLKKEYTTMFQA